MSGVVDGMCGRVDEVVVRQVIYWLVCLCLQLGDDCLQCVCVVWCVEYGEYEWVWQQVSVFNEEL